MKSFINNPEISLVVSNKSLPKKVSSKNEKSSQPSSSPLVTFNHRELELLLKLNDLKVKNSSGKSSTNEKKKEKQSKRDKTISLTIQEVKELKAGLEESEFLCDIIEDSELKLPENEIVERNPELEKRIQRLKAQQEQRVYNSMTKNVDSSRRFQPEETISFQLKQINRQLIAVAQFVFSVISGFFFGFLGIELIIGNLDFGFRLLLGIICALVIALAEIYFLAKKLNEELPVEAEELKPSPTKTSGSEKLKTN